MLRVGLTGGIGSGKSTVARLFAAQGAPIVDADEIVHQITRSETSAERPSALNEIVAAFGTEMLNPSGELDRRALADRIFVDRTLRMRLERILHPRVRAEMSRHMDALARAVTPPPYCIAVIPLLAETGFLDLVDRVLVVDCSPETQIARAMARDGLTEEAVRVRLVNQATRAQRNALADDLIGNEGTIESLETGVVRLDHFFRTQARLSP